MQLLQKRVEFLENIINTISDEQGSLNSQIGTHHLAQALMYKRDNDVNM